MFEPPNIPRSRRYFDEWTIYFKRPRLNAIEEKKSNLIASLDPPSRRVQEPNALHQVTIPTSREEVGLGKTDLHFDNPLNNPNESVQKGAGSVHSIKKGRREKRGQVRRRGRRKLEAFLLTTDSVLSSGQGHN